MIIEVVTAITIEEEIIITMQATEGTEQTIGEVLEAKEQEKLLF